jgi:phospholipid/cholesterol/gamma-HCH transport system substrate-binding protein
MRSRIVREGAVGLLILAGAGVFLGSVAWLKGLNPANRSFTVNVSFPTIAGVQTGSTVRYRGVSVGRIQAIKNSSEGVSVEIAVSPADLVIPADVEATIDQSGLLGENVINLTPKQATVPQVAAKPLDGNCDKGVILCDGSRISGDLGISTDALVKSSIRFANLYGQPEFYDNLNRLTANSGKAAAEIATMSREFGILARSFRQEIGTLSETAVSISGAANQAGLAANQAGITASKASVSLDQINGLLTENRVTLVSTLENINQTSSILRVSVNQLPGTIDRFQRSRLLTDLETLSANAAAASLDLKNASQSFNNPATLTSLQQTLDAARATFQNAQKITSDLDELTGDPAVRQQFKDVIKGFGQLLSSSEQLQQRTVYAQQMEPAAQQMALQRDLALQRQLALQQQLARPQQTAPPASNNPTIAANRANPITPNLAPPAPQLSARPIPQP